MSPIPALTSKFMPPWRLAVVALTVALFALSVRWSLLDNSPPAWDQGHYLYQATKLHLALREGGGRAFLSAVFNLDPGRVPLILVLVQPAFYLFGPVLDAAVITLNLCWFLLAWALYGIAREMAWTSDAGKASFFALALFGFYPLTVLVAHNFLVELLLASLVCASIYSILMLEKRRSIGWAVVCGLFIGLGLLTKVTFVVFVFPALVLTALSVYRSTSFKKAVGVLVPGLLAALLIALPYYIYNFREILSLTVSLSSKELAALYGFGDVFEVSTILNYWVAVFDSPVFVIVLIALVFAVFQRIGHRRQRFVIASGFHLAVLGLWFIPPLFLATFGHIKDPRYLFPALTPLFIVSGLVIARPQSPKPAWTFIALTVIFTLPGFLYSNAYLDKGLLDRIARLPGLHSVGVADIPPDPQDWQSDRLVKNMAAALVESTDNRKVIVLGGNRYHHLRLLDYYGLMRGTRFDYLTLPYYANPNMTLADAVEFIKSTQAAGVIFKTGENWPEFTSRLDTKIVDVLRNDPQYEEQQLDVLHPDGSRFLLFRNKASLTVPIDAPSRLFGDWKVGGGVAHIEAGSNDSLRVRTEAGDQSTAVLKDGSVYIEQWRVSGKLTADFSTIRWSNGSVWRR